MTFECKGCRQTVFQTWRFRWLFWRRPKYCNTCIGLNR